MCGEYYILAYSPGINCLMQKQLYYQIDVYKQEFIVSILMFYDINLIKSKFTSLEKAFKAFYVNIISTIT